MQERKPLLRRMMEKIRPKTKRDIAPSGKLELPEDRQKKFAYALSDAVFMDNIDEIERLIKAGADVAAKDNDGWNVMHWAANYGKTKICILLMKEYAKAGGDIKRLVTAGTGNLWTASMVARRHGHGHTARVLESIESSGDLVISAFIIPFSDCISS
jgi:ankyrin repeat protein